MLSIRGCEGADLRYSVLHEHGNYLPESAVDGFFPSGRHQPPTATATTPIAQAGEDCARCRLTALTSFALRAKCCKRHEFRAPWACWVFKLVLFSRNARRALAPGARRDDPGEGRHAGQNRAPCHVNRDHLPVPVTQSGEVGELVGAIGHRAKGRTREQRIERRAVAQGGERHEPQDARDIGQIEQRGGHKAQLGRQHIADMPLKQRAHHGLEHDRVKPKEDERGDKVEDEDLHGSGLFLCSDGIRRGLGIGWVLDEATPGGMYVGWVKPTYAPVGNRGTRGFHPPYVCLPRSLNFIVPNLERLPVSDSNNF